MVRKVILETNDGEELIPFTSLATNQEAGRVRPDGTTISVNANGVISTVNMQTTITGAATTVVSSNLTKSRAVVTNASGKLAASGITATELNYLDNVTSNIQTQLDGKQPTITNATTTEIGYLSGVTSAIQTQLNGKQPTITNATTTEIGYLSGVTSAIQTQLNGKFDSSRIQVVDDLPATRDPNTFYFVKES